MVLFLILVAKSLSMKKIAFAAALTTACFLSGTVISFAQTNIICTSPVAEQVMRGNYNPSQYLATNIINLPVSSTAAIPSGSNPDSLKSYIVQLASFKNRNTASDTVSSAIGIGAARRWAYGKFQQFS